MGKAKQRQYIENLAQSLIGQLKIDEGAGLESYNCGIMPRAVRYAIYKKVLVDIRRLNEATLTRIVCCGEAPAVSKADRTWPNVRSAFWYDLRDGEIHCPLDHVHTDVFDPKPVVSNWLADVEEKSGLEILRHIAATVITAAMYDVMNKRKNAGAGRNS